MIKKGDIVLIDYSVKISGNEEVIDSSKGKKPLAFLVGSEQVITRLDKDVVGKDDGYSVDLLIEPKDAYGDYNDNSFEELPREQFAGLELSEGMSLIGSTEDGGQVQVIVSSFDDKLVKVDYNHPLAGETLDFSYKIVSHRESTQEERDGAFIIENSIEDMEGNATSK